MGLRVVVADDSYLVREAITHVLADAPGIDLCAVCDHRDSLNWTWITQLGTWNDDTTEDDRG